MLKINVFTVIYETIAANAGEETLENAWLTALLYTVSTIQLSVTKILPIHTLFSYV